MWMKSILRIVSGGILVLLVVQGIAQKVEEPKGPPSTEAEYEVQYAERIKQTHLYDVYIPSDLTDAIKELVRLTPESSRIAYQNAAEDVVVQKLFFGLGRWMIYNWGFYEGSRLSHSLREAGIYNPDDMARVLMVSFHRHLNNKPLDVDSQIKMIQERVENERLEKLKSAKSLHEERRIVPPKEK